MLDGLNDAILLSKNKDVTYILPKLSDKTIFLNIATCCYHLADIRQPRAPICFRFPSFMAYLLNLDWKHHWGSKTRNEHAQALRFLHSLTWIITISQKLYKSCCINHTVQRNNRFNMMCSLNCLPCNKTYSNSLRLSYLYVTMMSKSPILASYFNRRDSSSGRASASCAVGQDGCRIDTWPRHTKDVIKMVPVATLLGAQHYKASTGFSSLTNHASLTSHN